MLWVFCHFLVKSLHWNDKDLWEIDEIEFFKPYQGFTARTIIVVLSMGESLFLEERIQELWQNEMVLGIYRVF